MKKTLLLTLIIILFLPFANGQCRYVENPNKIFKLACRLNCLNEVTAMTQELLLFNRINHAATVSFVKSADGYFLRLNIAKSKQPFRGFYFTAKTPLILQLEDGHQMQLHVPCETWGEAGLMAYRVCAFYRISTEQIEQLGQQKIEQVRLFFEADKRFKNGPIEEDEAGNYYMLFDLKAESKQKSCINQAACILDYSGK